jgi:hypothetical protein
LQFLNSEKWQCVDTEKGRNTQISANLSHKICACSAGQRVSDGFSKEVISLFQECNLRKLATDIIFLTEHNGFAVSPDKYSAVKGKETIWSIFLSLDKACSTVTTIAELSIEI